MDLSVRGGGALIGGGPSIVGGSLNVAAAGAALPLAEAAGAVGRGGGQATMPPPAQRPRNGVPVAAGLGGRPAAGQPLAEAAGARPGLGPGDPSRPPNSASIAASR